jgi:hypothetical protein
MHVGEGAGGWVGGSKHSVGLGLNYG